MKGYGEHRAFEHVMQLLNWTLETIGNFLVQTDRTFITGTLAYIGWWGNELTH